MLSRGTHPLNLGLRFILEMANLTALGYWGFNTFENHFSFIIGIGLPVLFAAIWGIFAVPNDPSRSGKTVIKTTGMIRLILELVFFSAGAITLFNLGFNLLFLAFSLIVIFHYLFSVDRIKWLLLH